MIDCDSAWREDFEAWAKRRDYIRKMRALALSWEMQMTKASTSEIGCAVRAVAKLCAQDLRSFADEWENEL